MCVVHVLQPIVEECKLEASVFSFIPATLRNKVRRYLVVLHYPDTKECAGKAFRAGRATSLAESTCSLGQILTAGHWSPASYLRYCRADELDVPSILKVVLNEEHDDE